MRLYKISFLVAFIMLLVQSACISSDVPMRQIDLKRPEIIKFQADLNKVEPGQSAVLSWEVVGADTIVIDNGIGEVPQEGSREIKPEKITAYNLIATNRDGVAGSAIIINVVQIAEISSYAINPQVTSSGTSVNTDPTALHVYLNGAVLVGADGHWITLRNNPVARNPAWAELKAFLQQDDTDKRKYEVASFTCGDFAEMLHNNAEAAGIRGALVGVTLKPNYPSGETIKHSLNAFETTDRGMVYIDVTSSSQGINADKVVEVVVGKDYVPVSVFPNADSSTCWTNMGRIESIDITQW